VREAAQFARVERLPRMSPARRFSFLRDLGRRSHAITSRHFWRCSEHSTVNLKI
jgi:hypothetical protein